jgi:vacuolar protein sorting-associated protein 35
MDRLANYYADEELLDEADTNEVKKNVARESFPMFEDCVQKVFQSRGPKLVSREVIRLQTALLNFSLKCHPGNMEQVSRCLGVCIEYIRQAANTTAIANETPLLEDSEIKLDQASVTELGKMLSIPLDSLALKVLELHHYADLLQFLPWKSRRDVGITMLRAIDTSAGAPTNVKELEELFSIILPVLHDPYSEMNYGQNQGERSQEMLEENSLVSKIVHLLDHDNPDVTYEMLMVARSHLSEAGPARTGAILVPVVFSALRLGSKVALESSASASGEKLSESANDSQKGDDADEKADDEENAKATDDEEKSEEVTKGINDEETPESEEGTKATNDENNGATPSDDDKDANVAIEPEEELMVQENNGATKEAEEFQSTLR